MKNLFNNIVYFIQFIQFVILLILIPVIIIQKIKLIKLLFCQKNKIYTEMKNYSKNAIRYGWGSNSGYIHTHNEHSLLLFIPLNGKKNKLFISIEYIEYSQNNTLNLYFDFTDYKFFLNPLLKKLFIKSFLPIFNSPIKCDKIHNKHYIKLQAFPNNKQLEETRKIINLWNISM